MEVVPVKGSLALGRFVGLPWSLYDRKRYPQWVPPLRAMVKDSLDERGNPFYRDAAREQFIALRDGRPVGRIAAIQNRVHNDVHQDRVGFFGFFESVDDQAVADALLDAAAGWLRSRGLDRMRGPISPSTNHECGLLVDGFEHAPTFMTPWNPPFYARLLDSAGLEKAKDLLAFWLPFSEGFALPERVTRALNRVRARSGFRFRLLALSDFPAEAERAWDVYNDAWEPNWGFVPMSREEFDHMAGMLKLLLVTDFACFAEVDGKPAAFAMALPDYNIPLQRLGNGRLFPGLPMLLWARKRLRKGRIMLLGVKRRFQGGSSYAVLLDELIRRAREYGAEGAEASWILEDNEPMLAFFRDSGLTATKRWRIYERAIPPV